MNGRCYKAYVKVGTAYLVITNTGLKLSENCSAHSQEGRTVFKYKDIIVNEVKDSTHCLRHSIIEALAILSETILAAVLDPTPIDKEILIKALVSLREAQDVYDKESVQGNA